MAVSARHLEIAAACEAAMRSRSSSTHAAIQIDAYVDVALLTFSDSTSVDIPFGAKIHYLPTADREAGQRQKVAPKMVEGLFAGYKWHSDGKWRGEYLVYDRTSYENWSRFCIHVE